MGRKLEPYSITAMRSLGEQFERSSSGKTSIKPKRTIRDEISDLSKQLLETLKRDTSISDTNHMIDVVTHVDSDGKERLYFHVSNMSYGEYYPRQQDCYGRIDENGNVELFKSRELSGRPEDEREAYSQYSPEERFRISEFKKIIEEEQKVITDEKENFSEKSAIGKMFSRISGKTPKREEKIRDFLLRLPKHLEEQKRKTSLDESLKVKPEDLKPVQAGDDKESDARDSGKEIEY